MGQYELENLLNAILGDLFAHNAWATSTLIETCRGFTDEQLQTGTAGSYGDIRATLEHMVFAEANYYRLLTGDTLYDPSGKFKGFSLDEINEVATLLEARWKAFMETPIDIDRTVLGTDDDGNSYDIATGVVLTQVFNHANVHREQICHILTVLGIEFPEIDGWNYAAASGRARPAVAQEAG